VGGKKKKEKPADRVIERYAQERGRRRGNKGNEQGRLIPGPGGGKNIKGMNSSHGGPLGATRKRIIKKKKREKARS